MEELKKKLQELADRRFYLDMKSHWDQEDFDLDNELFKKIQNIIKEFETKGIKVNYRHGYPIEYKEI